MRENDLIAVARAELTRWANPAKAEQMQAYMKTDMPFYGVTSPQRRVAWKELKRRFPPGEAGEYRAAVESLWAQPHREEKYLALDYAQGFRRFVTFDQIDLYETLVREGAWWDLVDDIATHLVGPVVLADRERMRPILERWIDDPDLWIRRTAIICQLGHRDRIDQDMLFDFCLRRSDETGFFIRKAIGWALRQHARTDPDAVRRFVDAHRDRLSPPSIREATKHL